MTASRACAQVLAFFASLFFLEKLHSEWRAYVPLRHAHLTPDKLHHRMLLVEVAVRGDPSIAAELETAELLEKLSPLVGSGAIVAGIKLKYASLPPLPRPHSTAPHTKLDTTLPDPALNTTFHHMQSTTCKPTLQPNFPQRSLQTILRRRPSYPAHPPSFHNACYPNLPTPLTLPHHSPPSHPPQHTPPNSSLASTSLSSFPPSAPHPIPPCVPLSPIRSSSPPPRDPAPYQAPSLARVPGESLGLRSPRRAARSLKG